MIPARPGNKLSDFLTTDWYNKTLKPQKQRPQNFSTSFEQQFDHCNCIQAPGDSGDIGWLEPVIISGTRIDTTTDPNDPAKTTICAVIEKPTESNIREYLWGIALNPFTPGSVGRVVIQGLTWAKFTRSTALHGFVYLDPTDLVLKSSWGGGAAIVSFTASSGSEGYGLIKLGAPSEGAKLFHTEDIITGRDQFIGLSNEFKLGFGPARMCKVHPMSGDIKAQIINPDVSLTIYNKDTREIPSGSLVRASLVDGYFVAESVIFDVQLQISGLDYQIKINQEDWVTWATGAECPATAMPQQLSESISPPRIQ